MRAVSSLLIDQITDLEGLRKLQKTVTKVKNEDLPPVILLTGRPVPYCESVIQDIDALGPGFEIDSIAENGAIYWDHNNQRISAFHPKFEENLESGRLREAVERLKKEYDAVEEPGKEICVSLNPTKHEVTELYSITRQVLKENDIIENFNVDHSSTAVDITPKGVNKKSGLAHLLCKEDIDSEKVLGVGDSQGDIEWLSSIGHPAAPANSSKEVKNIENVFVAGSENVRGVNEILEEFLGQELGE